MNGEYKGYTDGELVKLLASSDEAAYTELYDRYWERLYLFASRMLQDEEQGMDIVQDLFTTLWHNRYQFDIRTSLKTYLYTSVRNLTLNYINRSKQKDRYLQSLVSFFEKGVMNTEEQVLFKEFSDRIDRQVERFSPQMKQIFVLSRNEGLSNKAIADELGITDHAVKKAINRALKVLRGVLSVLAFLF